MKIVFYVGYYTNPWNANSLNSTGLGGTEQSVIHLAKQIAKFLYNQVWIVGNVIPDDIDGVKYRTTQQFKKEESSVDTIIGVGYIHYIKEFENFNYKNSIFWIHNTDYYPWWNGKEIVNHRDLLLDSKLKHIICLTKWHKEVWLQKIRDIANQNNFALDRKELKNEPQKFTGFWADVPALIRVALAKRNKISFFLS